MQTWVEPTLCNGWENVSMGTIRPRPMTHRPGCEEPDVVETCKCGSNVVCRTCHWGSGSIPCACTRPNTT